MSHLIIYNKLFVKLQDGNETKYIPMMLKGANNCTQTSNKGREIRERSWGGSNMFMDGILTDEKSLLPKIDAHRLDLIERGKESVKRYNDESFNYDDKRYGWHSGVAISGKGTTGTSFNSYKNLYVLGMKQAVTIEELAREDVYIHLYVSTYSKENIENKGLKVLSDITFTDTEQALKAIKHYEEYYKGIDCLYVTFQSEFYTERYLKNKNKKKERKPTQYKEVEFYFVLANNKGFFIKRTKYGYRYTTDSNWAKKFVDFKQADTKLKKLDKLQKWEVLKVNEKTNIKM